MSKVRGTLLATTFEIKVDPTCETAVSPHGFSWGVHECFHRVLIEWAVIMRAHKEKEGVLDLHLVLTVVISFPILSKVIIYSQENYEEII